MVSSFDFSSWEGAKLLIDLEVRKAQDPRLMRSMSFFLTIRCHFCGGSNWHLEFEIALFSASGSHFRDRKAHSADMVLVDFH